LNGRAASGRLLIVEPQFVLRRTVSTMARQMGLAEVDEAATVAMAGRLLFERRFDGLLIALDERGEALLLLEGLRTGAWPQPAGLPVAAMASACDVELALRLKELDVTRLLLKPFKVRGVLEAMSALRASEPLPER
jgi:DNA-binding response OmpR family regulator